MKIVQTHKAGFTLIEILIVLFIISITAGVVMLTIGGNDNRQLASFATELTELITLAQEQALLQPKVLGLRIDENDFYFVSYEEIKKKKFAWLPLPEDVFGRHKVPRSVQLDVKVPISRSAHEDMKLPQIIISTNGDLTPFTIYIGKRDQKPRYAIIGKADGSVANKQLF